MTGIFSISVLMCKSIRAYLTPPIPLRILILLVMLVQACQVSAQNKAAVNTGNAIRILADRGEIVIRFIRPGDYQMEFLTRILSVDKVINDTVYAYANSKQFEAFLGQNISFEIVPAPSLKTTGKISRVVPANWRTQYPSYPLYLSLMDSFTRKYPDLCGLTYIAGTPGNHKLLALRISGPAGSQNEKPAVFLTSSIHGDEPLGYVLLLRLIDTLLNQYGKNAELTALVDNVEIWINPLANPDGTFFVSDSTIYGATRFNSNQVDLNRNFPDPVKGEHPDSYDWQSETLAMMSFMKKMHPVLSANFHGGSEVVNYPWDAFRQLHPDDAWFRLISRQWVDTAHAFSYPGYMTAKEDGITNGFSWYPVYGGRQDYVNYFIRGREVTIELSNDKIPGENNLDNYWNYNYRSLLGYIEQVNTGISGIVRDSVTGLPVKAMISIPGHDKDNSQVYSDSIQGLYFRLLQEGNYVIESSAAGYTPKQIAVKVEKGQLTRVNIFLSPLAEFVLYPNPFTDILRIDISEPGKSLDLKFIDLSGREAKHITKKIISAGRQEIRIEGLAQGMYIVEITYGEMNTRETLMKIH
jgi:hypothetical protein